MEIFYFPCSNGIAYDHFLNTIQSTKSIVDIEDSIDDAIKNEIRNNVGETFRIWGVIPGVNNNKTYAQLQVGDIVVFYRLKRIISTCKVKYKMTNRDISAKLWDYDDEGRTWELLVFLDEFNPMDVASTKTDGSLLMYQGFTRVGADNKDRVLELINLPTPTPTMVIAPAQTTINTSLSQIIDDALKKHKQIVLTGAPGTGKTYGAKKYVEAQTSNDKTKYRFVQFHPSYDYSDFVEGLRPVILENSFNDDPTFVRVDGVFKAFCREIILNNYKETTRNVINQNQHIKKYWIRACNPNRYKITEAYQELQVIDWTQSKNYNVGDIVYLYTSGSIKKISHKCIVEKVNIPFEETIDDRKFWVNEEEDWNKDRYVRLRLLNTLDTEITLDDLGIYRLQGPITLTEEQVSKIEDNETVQSETDKIIDFETFKEKYLELEEKDKFKTKYYFVIDEINRADLSKVFGELMYGLEESYRGIKHPIKTQYKNLTTHIINQNGKGEPLTFDCFKEGFFIPTNLYIIGTMNDIDKSVEAFDFALRRRFEWIEIMAKDVAKDSLTEMLTSATPAQIDDLVAKINALNDVISNEGKSFGLSDAYHIGHAYFKNVDVNDPLSLEKIFNRNIVSILREYTRGRNTEYVDEFIEYCASALGVNYIK